MQDPLFMYITKVYDQFTMFVSVYLSTLSLTRHHDVIYPPVPPVRSGLLYYKIDSEQR